MAGAILATPAVGAADWSGFISQVEGMRRGYMAVHMTNMYASAESQIENGSIVDVGGALYQFTTAETVTGWAGFSTADNVFITVVASAATCTAVYSSTNPVWSEDHQGFYASGDTTIRYIGGAYKGGATSYQGVWLFGQVSVVDDDETRGLYMVQVDIGAWDMDTVGTLYVYPNCNIKRIRSLTGIIQTDDGTNLKPIPYMVNGAGGTATADVYFNWARNDGTDIDIAITRWPGGTFDGSAAYNGAGNRGWVTMVLER